MTASSAQVEDSGAPTTVRVIVADDDSRLRAALADLIGSEAGMNLVGVACDADEAIELGRQLQPDVALIDVRMPGGGGIRAARELRLTSPRTRVVALSAHGDRDSVLQMLGVGAVGYLVKSASADDVVDAVWSASRNTGVLAKEVTSDVIGELASHLIREQRERDDKDHQVQRLRRVIDSRLIMVIFQPIVDLASGEVVGVEALSRFPVQPSRTPDHWFAEAWAIDLGVELEMTAVRTALEAAAPILATPHLSLNLNVSPDVAMTAALAEAINEHGAVDRVILELTEHAVVANYSALNRSLAPLRERGLRLAVDDAGAGYASLRHILRLAPDFIKLDISLTAEIDRDRSQRALARGLISFAKEIDAQVVAEGIETQSQLDTLRDLGASLGQGYFLGRPGHIPAQGLSAREIAPRVR